MSSVDEPYLLHRLVWDNNHEGLKNYLSGSKCDIDVRDCRGSTALHLAVVLGHVESARVLLENGASASAENPHCWTVTQEAVTSGDPELVQLCIQHRDHQRLIERCTSIPRMMSSLQHSDDFCVEMKWEFTSWVPLVSRMCPSDTYRVWKSGSRVRIDTTLLGFENLRWQRGSRSYIFNGHDERSTTLLEVDHDSCQVYSETVSSETPPPRVSYMCPTDEAVATRLASPVTTTYLDTERVSFERSRCGVWGWRSDRSDCIDGYTCKVCSASNVHLVTRTRMEHLGDGDRRRGVKPNPSTPLQSFLGAAEQGGANKSKTPSSSKNSNSKSASSSFKVASTSKAASSFKTTSSLKMSNKSASSSFKLPSNKSSPNNRMPSSHKSPLETSENVSSPTKISNSFSSNLSKVTAEEYFNESVNLDGRCLGASRPPEETVKVHKLKARLWLCENYPLSLPSQVLPLIDLMASSSAHFRRLRDFITLRLPSGFPVKIEIPLYHILNARITFCNVNGVDRPMEGVTLAEESKGGTQRCIIDPSIFSLPSHYSMIGDAGGHTPNSNNSENRRKRDDNIGGDCSSRRGRAQDGGGAVNSQYMDAMEDVALHFALRRSLMDSQAGGDPSYYSLCNGYNEYTDIHTDGQTDTAGEAGILTQRRRSRFSSIQNVSDEDRLIQWALEESLKTSNGVNPEHNNGSCCQSNQSDQGLVNGDSDQNPLSTPCPAKPRPPMYDVAQTSPLSRTDCISPSSHL